MHMELHTMGLVRTNITIPAEILALVDEIAGPRGRSAYISDVVARQVRRDNAVGWSGSGGSAQGLDDLGRDAGRDPRDAARTARQLGARPHVSGEDW